jgi:hypothetical protein
MNMPFPVFSGILAHLHSTTGDVGTDSAVLVLDAEGGTVVTPPSVVGASTVGEATSDVSATVGAAGLEKT